jgi:hypothetical protein
VVDYLIVGSGLPGEPMDQAVREKLADGWQPWGTPLVYTDPRMQSDIPQVVQAMVLYADDAAAAGADG